MAWKKSSPALIALFDEVAPRDPIAERRKEMKKRKKKG